MPTDATRPSSPVVRRSVCVAVRVDVGLWPEETPASELREAAFRKLEVIGVTTPKTPAMRAGSNFHVVESMRERAGYSRASDPPPRAPWRVYGLPERYHRLLVHVLESALRDGYLVSDWTRKMLAMIKSAKRLPSASGVATRDVVV